MEVGRTRRLEGALVGRSSCRGEDISVRVLLHWPYTARRGVVSAEAPPCFMVSSGAGNTSGNLAYQITITNTITIVTHDMINPIIIIMFVSSSSSSSSR